MSGSLQNILYKAIKMVDFTRSTLLVTILYDEMETMHKALAQHTEMWWLSLQKECYAVELQTEPTYIFMEHHFYLKKFWQMMNYQIGCLINTFLSEQISLSLQRKQQMIFLAFHLSLEENFGKLEFTTVNFIIPQHLKAFLMRLVVIVTKFFYIV